MLNMYFLRLAMCSAKDDKVLTTLNVLEGLLFLYGTSCRNHVTGSDDRSSYVSQCLQ